jgi:murein DD-endopeptidase MepM/ murein hydrolase activator NlpD
MKNAIILGCLFCLPLKHLSLTSPFGCRVHPIAHQFAFHSGIDLRACHDTVYAVFDGTASVGHDNRLGVHVTVSDSGLICSYGHLSTLFISEGPVVCGQPIAITGATGQVTGEHLHFSIKFNGKYLDPLKFLYQLNLNQYPYEYQFQTPDRPGLRKTKRANQGRHLDLPAQRPTAHYAL